MGIFPQLSFHYPKRNDIWSNKSGFSRISNSFSWIYFSWCLFLFTKESNIFSIDWRKEKGRENINCFVCSYIFLIAKLAKTLAKIRQIFFLAFLVNFWLFFWPNISAIQLIMWLSQKSKENPVYRSPLHSTHTFWLLSQKRL